MNGYLYPAIACLLLLLSAILWALTRILNAMSDPLKIGRNKEISKKNLTQVQMCTKHPQVRAQNMCSISHQLLCSSCLYEIDGKHLSRELAELYKNSQWEFVGSTVASTQDSTENLKLYKFKEESWNNYKIPMLSSVHYKINLENDHIESHFHLYADKAQVDQIKNELNSRGL